MIPRDETERVLVDAFRYNPKHLEAKVSEHRQNVAEDRKNKPNFFAKLDTERGRSKSYIIRIPNGFWNQ